jgi:hypothetical protein
MTAKNNNTSWNAASCKKAACCTDMNKPMGQYPLKNYYKDCDAASARKMAYCNHNMNVQDGYGWVSLNGCLVDQDSKTRNNATRITHTKGRHHLEDRTNLNGSKARGPLIVDTETLLKLANFNPKIKFNGDVFDYRLQFLPIENSPQRLKHIIPPKTRNGGWVRGGMDTRMQQRKVAHATLYKKYTVQ